MATIVKKSTTSIYIFFWENYIQLIAGLGERLQNFCLQLYEQKCSCWNHLAPIERKGLRKVCKWSTETHGIKVSRKRFRSMNNNF